MCFFAFANSGMSVKFIDNLMLLEIISCYFHVIRFCRCEHEIHLWGRVFNLENISLYGSACIKAATEPRGCQEISFLVDAKVAGVQIEVSGCAAEALSSVLVTLMPETSDICGEEYRRPTYSRQVG